MKYLEKSFTLPANSRLMTDEQWEAIWNPPPATESEHPVTDTVALGAYLDYKAYADEVITVGSFGTRCPSCHCAEDSTHHTETCVTPHEED